MVNEVAKTLHLVFTGHEILARGELRRRNNRSTIHPNGSDQSRIMLMGFTLACPSQKNRQFARQRKSEEIQLLTDTSMFEEAGDRSNILFVSLSASIQEQSIAADCLKQAGYAEGVAFVQFFVTWQKNLHCKVAACKQFGHPRSMQGSRIIRVMELDVMFGPVLDVDVSLHSGVHCDLQGCKINFANSKTLAGRCRDRP